MRRSMIFLCLGGCLLLFSGCAQQVRLFNGNNLDGWKPYTGENEINPARVWSVKNGMIRCEGKPNGYLRTTRPYSNFKLHVEWRWPQQPSNSGILLYITGPDQIWPTCVEAQLRSGDAGDLVLIGEDVSIEVNGQQVRPEDSRYLRIPKIHPSNEKKAGQWNICEITCKNGTMDVYINGLLQNTGAGCSLTSGLIGLQSEGSPIDFRNIILEPLPQ